MSSTFSVSVVVPTYNSAGFVTQTLRTVLAQTLPPTELIVSDDGSQDNTCAVVEELFKGCPHVRTVLLRNPHRGPGATRNAGVEAAQGEWIAFLDSDDLWEPQKLETIFAAIQRTPGVNLLCHEETIRALNGTRSNTNWHHRLSLAWPIPGQLYNNNSFSTSAVVCRRELVRMWGGFDESLASAQDYELWLRMSPDLVVAFVPEVLGEYVVRLGNITTTRYWRRLRNELIVKYWHRDKAGVLLFLRCGIRIVLSHLSQPIRTRFRNRFGQKPNGAPQALMGPLMPSTSKKADGRPRDL